jgi:hypothetical protein
MTPPAPVPVAYRRFDGPAAPEWIAVFVAGGSVLPGIFTGATRDEAMNAARDWWLAEQAAIAKAKAARGEPE